MYHSRLAFALAMAALAAILLPSSLPAQTTFQRTYGGARDDDGFCVEQTTDGGYVIAGSTTSFGAGKEDLYIVRTDANGDTLWTRTLGGTDYDDGYSIRQTSDSGFIVAGYTQSFGDAGDVYLIRTDARGDVLWFRTYGGWRDDIGKAVELTPDGGYIVAGYTGSFGSGDYHVWLVKTDDLGDTLWTRYYGRGGWSKGYSVCQTADGGYIVVGFTDGAGNGDVYLVKTDASGDTSWTKTYGGASIDDGYSVQQTDDGGFVIVGATGSFGAGQEDVYLIKTDSVGDTVWTRTFGGTGFDRGQSVRQTANGGYIIAGTANSFGAGTYDVYLIKTDAQGDTMWTRTFGGANWDWGYSVEQTADGGYAVAGRTYSFGVDSEDVYLIKTDSLGNVAVAEPKAIPTRASALLLSCEPNPCRGATTISLKPQASSSKPLKLRVYDAGGNLVWSQPVRTSSFIFHPSSLPSGAYFIRGDIAGEHVTARLILQR